MTTTSAAMNPTTEGAALKTTTSTRSKNSETGSKADGEMSLSLFAVVRLPAEHRTDGPCFKIPHFLKMKTATSI